MGLSFEVVFVLVLGFILWTRGATVAVIKNPRLSSTFQRLEEFGPLEEVVQAIESEVKEKGERVGNLIFTPRYLVEVRRAEVVRTADVAWVYKKVTKHSINFVPIGKTYDVVICLCDGTRWEVGGEATVVDQMLSNLAKNSPWIVVGHSDELERLWQRSRDEFVAKVRKKQQA